MAIVKMQRVCVIGLDNEKEEFMSRLMDFGVVELTDQSAKLSDKIWAENVTADESRDETARLEEKISRVNLALEVIEKYGNLKQPLFATRRKVSMQGMRCLMADSGNTIREQVEDILNLNHRINAICERRTKLLSKPGRPTTFRWSWPAPKRPWRRPVCSQWAQIPTRWQARWRDRRKRTAQYSKSFI